MSYLSRGGVIIYAFFMPVPHLFTPILLDFLLQSNSLEGNYGIYRYRNYRCLFASLFSLCHVQPGKILAGGNL